MPVFRYTYWDTSYGFAGSFPAVGLSVVSALHDELWCTSPPRPQADADVRRMAEMDHPLARVLTLFYCWKGDAFERFGIDFRGALPAELLRAIALRVLRETPVRFLSGEALDHVEADAPPTYPEGSEVRWMALRALGETALEEDGAVITSCFSRTEDDEEKKMALNALAKLEQRTPGFFLRSGLLADLCAAARIPSDTTVQIEALGMLADHAWSTEVAALLETNAREGQGELAWGSARILFFRDMRAYWLLPQTVMARTGAPQGYDTGAPQGYDVEYEELERAVVDITGIEAACVGSKARPFTYPHPTQGGIWVAFLAQEGFFSPPVPHLERLHDKLSRDLTLPEKTQVLATIAAIDHPLARWALLMHQPKDADEQPAARPALRSLALAVLHDPQVDTLAGEELTAAGAEGASARALSLGTAAANHAQALLTLVQVAEKEDYDLIAGFITDEACPVHADALITLYSMEERFAVGVSRGNLLDSLDKLAHAERDLWTRRWAIKLLGKATDPAVLPRLEALAQHPEAALADAAALSLLDQDRGRYLELARQVLCRTERSWDHFELTTRAA